MIFEGGLSFKEKERVLAGKTAKSYRAVDEGTKANFKRKINDKFAAHIDLINANGGYILFEAQPNLKDFTYSLEGKPELIEALKKTGLI